MPERNALAPRPTTYKGIAMRSRLEAAWAEQFDAWGQAWQYEPQCYASEEGQYLPDFLLTPGSVFVEVKPWIDNDQIRDVLQEQMPRAARILHHNQGDQEWGLLVMFGATPRRTIHTFGAKQLRDNSFFFLPVDLFGPGARYAPYRAAPVASLHADRFV